MASPKAEVDSMQVRGPKSKEEDYFVLHHMHISVNNFLLPLIFIYVLSMAAFELHYNVELWQRPYGLPKIYYWALYRKSLLTPSLEKQFKDVESNIFKIY